MLKLTSDSITKGWSIKSNNNSILTEHSDILGRWHQFYSQLYHSNRTTFAYFDEEEGAITNVEIDELLLALRQLKAGKATGPDGLSVEMLRAGGQRLHKLLLDLINLIITTRNIPEQLIVSEIILLFKKGDLRDCGNYRPISLLCHVYKLMI